VEGKNAFFFWKLKHVSFDGVSQLLKLGSKILENSKLNFHQKSIDDCKMRRSGNKNATLENTSYSST